MTRFGWCCLYWQGRRGFDWNDLDTRGWWQDSGSQYLGNGPRRGWWRERKNLCATGFYDGEFSCGSKGHAELDALERIPGQAWSGILKWDAVFRRWGRPALPLARQCLCGVSEKDEKERKKGARWYSGAAWVVERLWWHVWSTVLQNTSTWSLQNSILETRFHLY